MAVLEFSDYRFADAVKTFGSITMAVDEKGYDDDGCCAVMRRWRWAVWVVVMDQLSKYVAQSVGLILINSGTSFGIGENWPAWLCLRLHGLVLAGLALAMTRADRVKWAWLAIILAAGFSNWLDRWRFGGVRDWLWLPVWGGYNNLADWLVVIGCLGWLGFWVKIRLEK